MFDHVTIRAEDRPASERFYRTVLATLEIEPSYSAEDMIEWDDFSIIASEVDLEDLIAQVARMELPDRPGEDCPAHPLDPAPLIQSAAHDGRSPAPRGDRKAAHRRRERAARHRDARGGRRQRIRSSAVGLPVAN